MTRILLISLAGGLGTAARYGLGTVAQKFLGTAFPWGTLTVNLLGSFLFGWIWGLEALRHTITPETRLILLIGFMGGFTTFSSFAAENLALLRAGNWPLALLNITLQNTLALAAVWAGNTLARPQT